MSRAERVARITAKSAALEDYSSYIYSSYRSRDAKLKKIDYVITLYKEASTRGIIMN